MKGYEALTAVEADFVWDVPQKRQLEEADMPPPNVEEEKPVDDDELFKFIQRLNKTIEPEKNGGNNDF